MKKARKVLSLILALVMVLALAVTASAAGEGTPGKITITPPEGTQAVENTYTVYKIFGATVSGTGDDAIISYKPIYDTLPAGFELDAGGNVIYSANKDKTEDFITQLSDADIAALAEYVKDNSITGVEVRTTGITPAEINVAYGYYYITTSTGTVVTVNSTKPEATVKDKNEIPTITKTVNGEKKVIIEAGKTIPFIVTIEVKKGAKDYKLVDTMGAGLEFVAGSMKIDGVNVDAADLTVDTTTTPGQTIITYKIPDTKLVVGNNIEITYSAKVTSDTLSASAAKNSAKVTYGKGDNSTTTDEVEVYNAKITVTKTDGNNQPLAGASFVLRNDNASDTENYGKYYSIANNDVAWVESADAAKIATAADADGKQVVTFTGLSAGTYTLIEQVVPDGYNKAEDQTIVITEDQPGTEDDADVFNTNNLEKNPIVVNNAGIELPATGGIGTTIFTVVGGVLMVGAAILFITKKRSEDING